MPPLYYQYIHNKWRWNDKEHYHCNANDKEWEETGSIAGLSSLIQEYLHGMGMGIETHEYSMDIHNNIYMIYIYQFSMTGQVLYVITYRVLH